MTNKNVELSIAGRTASIGPVVSLLLAFALLLNFTSASAQVTTADVVGTVTDQTGAGIPNAKVTITNTGTQITRRVQTTDGGDYTLTLLPPGHYSLQIEADQFKSFKVSDVTLAAGDRTRIDGKMQVGTTSETVEVSTAAPLLQADSSSVSSSVTENAVQDIPLNGRNFNGLVQVQAGVNTGPANGLGSGSRPDDRRESSTFSANGQSDLFNNQLIDGIDNNERVTGSLAVRPSIDAIAEIKVTTNNYTAEVGRSAGAVVDIVTKSGTNAFHGSIYEFFRNDVLDGRDFFAKAGIVKKPEYRENEFGGSIGGPIFKDKTFFFADIEENRIIQGTTYTSTVPTAFEISNPGNFSDIGGPILTKIDPVGLNYFKLYPSPNVPGTNVNNFVYTPNKTYFATSGDARIDHHFGDRDSMFGRYSYNGLSTTIPPDFPLVSVAGVTVNPGAAASFAGPNQTGAHSFQLDYVRIINPNLVLNLKAGYVRVSIATLAGNDGTNVSQAFGVINSNLSNFAHTSGLMLASITGYQSLGDAGNLPIIDINNSYQYLGTMSYSRGAHNFKMGGSLIRRQVNRFVNTNGLGAVSFTSLPNLLSGTPNTVTRSNQIQGLGYRMWEVGGFIQDDWRATSSLTVNLGLRYDVFTPVTEVHDGFTNFDPTTYSLILGGTGGINTNYAALGPRVGFAQSFGHGLVLRGGYGISYYPIQIQSQMQNVNAPYFYTQTACAYPCNGLSWPSVPVPTPSSTTNLSGSLSYLPSNYNTATINMMNLNIEKAFGENVFSIGYVGQLSRHLTYKTSIDLPAPTGPYPLGTLPAAPKRLFLTQLPNVTGVAAVLPVGTWNYHSLQTTFARRYKNGLSFNANYTWAHELGDALSGSGSSTGMGLISTNPHYDYGNGDEDIRHRIALTFTYEIPFGNHLTGIAGALSKGWQVNSLLFWQTGPVFTVIDARVNTNKLAQINLPNTTSDRPDIIHGVPLYSADHGLGQWFNLAAFSPQQAGTAGSEQRNYFYGPHARRADLSIFRTFNLHESIKLESRVECFNISNTPNFSPPGSTIATWTRAGVVVPATQNIQPGDVATNGGGFGSVSSTNPSLSPRQFQFALKLLF